MHLLLCDLASDLFDAMAHLPAPHVTAPCLLLAQAELVFVHHFRQPLLEQASLKTVCCCGECALVANVVIHCSDHSIVDAWLPK